MVVRHCFNCTGLRERKSMLRMSGYEIPSFPFNFREEPGIPER